MTELILTIGAVGLAALAILAAYLRAQVSYLTRELADARKDRDDANKRTRELLQQRIDDARARSDRFRRLTAELVTDDTGEQPTP